MIPGLIVYITLDYFIFPVFGHIFFQATWFFIFFIRGLIVLFTLNNVKKLHKFFVFLLIILMTLPFQSLNLYGSESITKELSNTIKCNNKTYLNVSDILETFTYESSYSWLYYTRSNIQINKYDQKCP